MSDIAVVTIVDYENYGNRLQAYALQQLLEMEGFSVSAGLDVISKDDQLWHTRSAAKRRIKKLMPVPVLNVLTGLARWVKASGPMRKRRKKFRSFSERFLHGLPRIKGEKNIPRVLSPSHYEWFVAGSDQVWSPVFVKRGWFFLTFAPPEQRLSFAASIGVEALPPEMIPHYKKLLSEMRYLSVREESAAKLIRELTGREADVTLDPTLLLPRSEWDKLARKPDAALPERYIVSFFLGELPPAVERFSAESGLPVVSLNDLKFPDLYALDPAEFLYVLGRADYVLTDSFHGTALSIKHHREFYVFRRVQKGIEDMFTRIEYILGRFGMEDREQNRERVELRPAVPESRWREIDTMLDMEREQSMAKLLELMVKV